VDPLNSTPFFFPVSPWCAGVYYCYLHYDPESSEMAWSPPRFFILLHDPCFPPPPRTECLWTPFTPPVPILSSTSSWSGAFLSWFSPSFPIARPHDGGLWSEFRTPFLLRRCPRTQSLAPAGPLRVGPGFFQTCCRL